jgi:hypothetical protein
MTEKRHFHEFFGTSVLVVKKTWELLERDSLLPEGCHPKHLLWALHFMKVYPKHSPGCSAVGASAGAVDPKTHRKWVWAFIVIITELVDVVVSNHSVCVFRPPVKDELLLSMRFQSLVLTLWRPLHTLGLSGTPPPDPALGAC